MAFASAGATGGVPRLAGTAERAATIDDDRLYGRHLVDPQHRIVVEVALLHSPGLDADFAIQSRRQTVDDAALHLRH